MSKEKNKNKELEQGLNDYLTNSTNESEEENCTGDECLIKTDKSLVERINKKIITEDGRQLLT